MKGKIKSVFSNGLPYGFVFFGLSFLVSYYPFRLDLQTSLTMSVIIGLAALFFNGITYSRFSKPLQKLERISFELSEPETTLIESPANHSIQNHLVPGKLFLTNQRLIFKEYRSNDNPAAVHFWNRENLKPIGFYGSIKNSGGEFLLRTQDNISLSFEVDKLKPWKQALQETKL